MQIAKWGNSLAVRLPASLVQELGLKSGDEIEVIPSRAEHGPTLAIARKPTREEIMEDIRKLSIAEPSSGYRFKRSDAYDEKRGGG